MWFQKDVKTQNISNDIFYLKILQQENCNTNLPHKAETQEMNAILCYVMLRYRTHFGNIILL